MARLILKSPYRKPSSARSRGGYLSYIATREGVEMAEDTSRHLPATAEQEKQGSNGLFTDEGVPIVLSQVQKK